MTVLINDTTIDGESPESKEMEVELKSSYTKICGRSNENNSGDSDNTDGDDIANDDLEGYDGFAGGFHLSHTTHFHKSYIMYTMLNQ